MKLSCIRTMSRSILSIQGELITIQQCRGMRDVSHPKTLKNTLFPPEGPCQLPTLPRFPMFDPELDETPFVSTSQRVEIRGPEIVHNYMWYKQFAIVARTGGQLRERHLNFIMTMINSNMNGRSFAVWRIPAPWLPRSKMHQNSRMSEKKAPLKYYVTPVKTGRVIVEVGGLISDLKIRDFLSYVAAYLPFQAECMSHEELEGEKAEIEKMERENTNPYTWDFMLRWNLDNCYKWTSPYDYVYRGRYR